MKKNMKIYIWGTGKIATQYIGCNEIPNENLCGFIETKKVKIYSVINQFLLLMIWLIKNMIILLCVYMIMQMKYLICVII